MAIVVAQSIALTPRRFFGSLRSSTSLALAANPLYLVLFSLQILLINGGRRRFSLLKQARRPGLLTKP